MKNENKPAFPVSEETTDRIDQGVEIYYGLTKREYFAAKAMQGIMSNPNTFPTSKLHYDNIVENSLRIAYSLLNGLELEQ
jgi:hypothetical protein